MNFNNYSCRLCLLDNNNNGSIFTGFNERSNLAAKIMQIANVQVYEGDGLTSLVCNTCINKVEGFVQFKSQIEKSDYFLRQQSNRFQVDPLSASIEKNAENIKSEQYPPLRKNIVFLQDNEWSERSSLEDLENIVRPSQDNQLSFPMHVPNVSLSFGSGPRPVSIDSCGSQIVDNQELSDEEKPKPFLELSDQDLSQRGLVPTLSTEKEHIPEITLIREEIPVEIERSSSSRVLRKDTAAAAAAAAAAVAATTTSPEDPAGSSSNINYFLNNSSGLDIENSSVLGKMKEFYNLVEDAEKKEEDDSTNEDMIESEMNDDESTELELSKQQSPTSSRAERDTDEKIDYCAQCDKHFDKPVSAKKHMSIHNREKYACGYCNKSFRQSWYLQSHVRTHTGERPFACSVCPKTFTDKSAMNAHIRVTHYTEKTLVCTYCNKAFKLKKQLERHERIHTGHQYHRCEICGKFYTQKSNLMKHLILHSGEKPFACPICEKRFAQKDNLNIHILRHHSQQNPIVCDVCGKLFKNKMTLMGHKKSKHSENSKQIICEVCGKFFPDRSCLNSHMWVHNVGTPVQCDQCGKSYPHERAVRVHKRIVHTEVRKYCCDVCGIGFKTSQTLKHHKVVHTGERAFSCDECGRSFGQKTALKTHMRIHSGIEPYSCNRCGESFKWKQTCDKHIIKCMGKRRDFLPHGIPDADLQNILQKRN